MPFPSRHGLTLLLLFCALFYGKFAVGARKSFLFTPNLGYTLARYTQTNITEPFLNHCLTVRLNADFRPKASKWEYSGAIQATPLLIVNGYPGSRALFLGWRTHVSRNISLSSGKELGIGLGIHYLTMIVQSDSYGFRNLLGPALKLKFSKDFSRNRTAEIYLSLGIFRTDLSAFSLTNTNALFGMKFSYGKGKRPRTISAEIQNVRTEFTSGFSDVTLASLLAGISF